jgi:glutathione S-transferase
MQQYLSECFTIGTRKDLLARKRPPGAPPKTETDTTAKRSHAMSLKLYYHPLASFCWKTLIALYENETPFEPVIVDLADETSRAAFLKVWPVGKFPVLRDDANDRTIPESTIIIEYLAEHYPGKIELLPADPDRALKVRLSDRFYDRYIHEPMQKIVTDRLRPPGNNDPHGVELARAEIVASYGIVEAEMAKKCWATGEAFTLADCAASPALFYASQVQLLGAHRNVAAYLDRLMQRPSFARVIKEAQPYFGMFPYRDGAGMNPLLSRTER